MEAIRVLRGVRAGAVKARTAAINQLKAMVVTAPATVREPLDGRSTARQVAACARLRPDRAQLADPAQATKAAPRTLGLLAIGIQHAGQLLTTAGDNPERLRGEPPLPTCAGRRRSRPPADEPGGIGWHRLHRGGDRDANCALHLAVVVRMRCCPRTRAYVERRTRKGYPSPRSCGA